MYNVLMYHDMIYLHDNYIMIYIRYIYVTYRISNPTKISHISP